MGHKTGFTATTLEKALQEAGFAKAALRRGENFDLWAAAYKDPDAELPELTPTKA